MATTPPAETDILCEACGYILNGLPESGNCPECGSPIDLSVAVGRRTPPVWEDVERSAFVRFIVTTTEVIFRPTRFFRSSTSRGDLSAALKFARIHWWITAVLLGATVWIHWHIYLRMARAPEEPVWLNLVVLAVLPLVTYLVVVGTLRLATRLTVWEATYRGYRLPQPVVLRALYYHAAHGLPVALLIFVTVAGYGYLQHIGYFQLTTAPAYLYVLSAEVFVAANYLFFTYWIAMRNLMYANR
jgi:hypothetical protein